MAAAAVFFTALVTLLATATAQTEQVTWAAVVLTYHGERIPDYAFGTKYLTPYGANEMLNAGQAVRDLYISSPDNASTSAVINGLSTNAIDNSQLYILGPDDIAISQSMQAFMQGLYPPRNSISWDQQNELSNSSLEEYPLKGYQYPAFSSVSELDFNYIWVDGNTGCNANAILADSTLVSDAFTQEVIATYDFYTGLNESVFASLPLDYLNYGNAWRLYELALFQYNHNTTFYNSSSFTADDLELLYAYASAQQWALYTPSANTTIQAMAGRTLAAKVLEQFSLNIASSGSSDKLTLLFGTHQPFLSFFALSNLATGPSAGRFNTLPLHGSVMTFELYSYATPAAANETIPFPDTAGLMVRFLFRNGTADNEEFIEYSLFDRGNSEADMTWSDFAEDMGKFSLNDLVDWCAECGSQTLFCQALEDNQSTTTPTTSTGTTSGHNGISPAVAGVIGAAVTIALVIIAAALLRLLGFRLEQRGDKNATSRGGDISVLKRSISGNGGFKGAEKLASDTDLRLKGGAGASIVRHERVGSWELNESPAYQKHSSLDKEIESGGNARPADYGRQSEDGFGNVNPFGDPVKPLDQV